MFVCGFGKLQESSSVDWRMIFVLVDLIHVFLSPCLSLSLSPSGTIRDAVLLLLVATSTWLCGLMAVNNSVLAFYYIFNVLCLLQV